MSEDQKINSILLRLRRTRYEDAYIAVPVTEAIMEQKEDGTYKLNYEAFLAQAMLIGNHPDVEWVTESTQIEPHQIQQPLPENREYFGAIYVDDEEEQN